MTEKIFVEKYIENTLKRLNFEISLLDEWFKENYKNYSIEIDVEFSKLRRSLFIRCRLYDQTRTRIQNKDTFLNIIRLDEKSVMNSSLINDFLRILNEEFRKEIVRLINNHRHVSIVDANRDEVA